MTLKLFGSVSSTLALALLCATGLHAQQRPRDEAPKPTPERDRADPMTGARRPYDALFGGAVIEEEPSNGLRFNASVFEAWDQNLLAEFTSPNTSTALTMSGAYTNLLGDLVYSRRSPRLQVAASAGANARYYSSISAFAANDYHGGGGVAVRPTESTTIAVNQSVSYAPVFLFGLFTDALTPPLGSVSSPDSAYAVNDDRAVTSDSSLDVEQRLTSRSRFAVKGSFLRSHFTVVTPRGTDFTAVAASGDYRYRLTQDSDLRLGYAFRQATFQGTEPFGLRPQQPAEHNIHVGVAFHPALSDRRRTIITFEGGTSLVNSALSTDVFQSRRQLRLVGDAAIAHQMGQTWLVVGAFKRGTAFVQGLSAPVFIDAVSVTTSGFVNRRADVVASVGYSNGEPSLVGSVVTFSTTTANARLRVALTPRWAFISEYFFYHYDFSNVLPLAAGLDPRVKRNTIRAGLTLWLPVNR